MGQQPESKTSPAITGKVLFNQVVVPYLCDTGADLTVISRAVYERMNTPKEPVLLRVYSGPRIKSFDNKISKVLGAVCVKKCAVAKDCVVKNAKVLVLEDIPQYECIMGRDLINRIPRLNKASLELRSAVESCAEDLLANLDEIVESQLAEPEDEPRSSYEEGEIVIFPGFKENQPAILVKQQAVPPEAGQPTVSSELEIVRETIQRELNEIAADKVVDINLERNRHMEFKIKLINLNTSPIRSKSRLLPSSSLVSEVHRCDLQITHR